MYTTGDSREKKKTSLVKLLKRFGLLKKWPKSRFSLEDYLNMPNLKIVIIYREKESCIRSMLKRRNITYINIFGRLKFKAVNKKTAENWYNTALSHMNILRQISHVVKFEDLLDNTEKIINDCCDFIGIDYQPKMLKAGAVYNYNYSHKTISRSHLI